LLPYLLVSQPLTHFFSKTTYSPSTSSPFTTTTSATTSSFATSFIQLVMMYDDVANDKENPFPGQLFNQPTAPGTPGTDVYHGVKKDYTGSEVTAKNFLSIITGDADAMKNIGTGRVLKSTENDKVFINFVDHGGVGLIAFPHQPYLYKKDLQNAIIKMHNTSMYVPALVECQP
jgi:glycosylphosphatidylinositol transamidase (GPIT) subunit GPI8